jgi:biopolymer transport protein ExbD
MKFGRRRDIEPEINVTSLIDVVLLLVMFFMVSTSFVQDGRLRIQLPESSAAPENHVSDPVVVAVGADGSYRVNGLAVVNQNPETLRAALSKVAGEGTRGSMLTIRADARATHQAVVTAMDVAGRLGFVQVNIATVNQQPGN